LPRVAIVGQRGGSHVRDVLNIHKRFRHGRNGKRNLARGDRFQQETLAEVLAEEVAAQNGPVGAAPL
jgi:hypothetical protein